MVWQQYGVFDENICFFSDKVDELGVCRGRGEGGRGGGAPGFLREED